VPFFFIERLPKSCDGRGSKLSRRSSDDDGDDDNDDDDEHGGKYLRSGEGLFYQLREPLELGILHPLLRHLIHILSIGPGLSNHLIKGPGAGGGSTKDERMITGIDIVI